MNGSILHLDINLPLNVSIQLFFLIRHHLQKPYFLMIKKMFPYIQRLHHIKKQFLLFQKILLVLIIAVFLGLIMIQPDIGGMAINGAIIAIMLLAADYKWGFGY